MTGDIQNFITIWCLLGIVSVNTLHRKQGNVCALNNFKKAMSGDTWHNYSTGDIETEES